MTFTFCFDDTLTISGNLKQSHFEDWPIPMITGEEAWRIYTFIRREVVSEVPVEDIVARFNARLERSQSDAE